MIDQRTALLIPVPAAEPLVAPWRMKYDISAAEGVPTHITLLYPFVPPASLDETLIGQLGQIAACIAPFPVEVGLPERLGDILALPIGPSAPLEQLRGQLAARWPEITPYGGKYGPHPRLHITVAWSAEARPGGAEDLDALARVLRPDLPISTRAEALWLMVRRDERWHLVREIALG